ncbi:TPA: hypothetical protein QDC55_003295 [Burkholderia cenocepacia]|nr:hypothetical protein [Burkholderia cenocepacia]HDR9810215.1 hypothetical protein [Burkholderia cenocepacia]HDR9817985.1 hypothetical protein [Burkholderia cenocepacia]HDR9829730.1 hypothetical protein [Burkholderia cenocepacia]
MIVIHALSDDEIIAGWSYFREWRASRNALLLFDALERVNRAEGAWIAECGPRTPLRQEWQVLRRCVMRGLARLRGPLLAASTPAQTEQALFRGKRRATLARRDQLNVLEVEIALHGSSIEQAMQILAGFGRPRARSYLVRKASELGLTPRQKASTGSKRARNRSKRETATGLHENEIAPGHRRYRSR